MLKAEHGKMREQSFVSERPRRIGMSFPDFSTMRFIVGYKSTCKPYTSKGFLPKGESEKQE